MRVCLISNQIAAWGKIGGFGTATRSLGAGLAQRGVEVFAVVPRRPGQAAVETLDGVTVLGATAWQTLSDTQVFRQIQADIYHSQEPTIASYLAQRAMPHARHVITCRDPRGMREHLVELRHASWRRRVQFPVHWYYEASYWVKQAVRAADTVLCPAPCIADRVSRLYGSAIKAQFIPSPVAMPASEPVKSPTPLVIFVGRWDRRKRIERFFELARQFPDVAFVAAGKAHEEDYDHQLRTAFGGLSNLRMPGYLPLFGDRGLLDLYARAWILVNTSAREGLPYTFLEAGAWGCALLAGLDPDGFAERFGYYARNGDFAAGLRFLLDGKRWRSKGAEAAAHIRPQFSEANSVREHLRCYDAVLARKTR